MAIFYVVFRNGLDEDGNTCEFPTDALNANGAEIEYFEHVESLIHESENFARETWQYEVPDADADRFSDGLDQTSTVLSYTRS